MRPAILCYRSDEYGWVQVETSSFLLVTTSFFLLVLLILSVVIPCGYNCGFMLQIRSVWLGADGDVILSASDDKELCAHRVHTGQLLTTFYAHEPVTKVLMTKDKLRIAAVVGQASPRLLMLQTHNF